MENALSRSLIKWWTRFEVWKKRFERLWGERSVALPSVVLKLGRGRLWGKNEKIIRMR